MHRHFGLTPFSFALNTNLNTTPRQLISGRFGIHNVHAFVFKSCVLKSWLREKKNYEEFFLLLSLHI